MCGKILMKIAERKVEVGDGVCGERIYMGEDEMEKRRDI